MLNAEVYEAEIIGLCGGLNAALSSPMAGLVSEVHVCKDNLIIAKEVGSVPNSSRQAAFIKFREGVKSWLQKGKKKDVGATGSKPHGNHGNERADQESKETCSSALLQHQPPYAHTQAPLALNKTLSRLEIGPGLYPVTTLIIIQ